MVAGVLLGNKYAIATMIEFVRRNVLHFVSGDLYQCIIMYRLLS